MTVSVKSKVNINPITDNVPLKVIRMLKGEIDIPRTMMVGTDCERKHGANGKTIRYVNSRNCIACTVHQKDRVRTEKNANDSLNKMHKVASEVRERVRMKSIYKEVWDE